MESNLRAPALELIRVGNSVTYCITRFQVTVNIVSVQSPDRSLKSVVCKLETRLHSEVFSSLTVTAKTACCVAK